MTSVRVALSAIALLALLVDVPAQTPSTTAFTGARVIDGTAAAPIDNATMLVRDGRIIAVGPAPRVTIPPGATRTSLGDHYFVRLLLRRHGRGPAAAANRGSGATHAAVGKPRRRRRNPPQVTDLRHTTDRSPETPVSRAVDPVRGSSWFSAGRFASI